MTKDGGPAFPRPFSESHETNDGGTETVYAECNSQAGMSLRSWFAGRGAACLPYVADDELWSHFRNNADSILEALRNYDAYMMKRDFRYADAMLAEGEKTED